MQKNSSESIFDDDFFGCLGEFSLSDPICKSLCVFNLRCAIEHEQQDKLELLEDIASSEFMVSKMH